MNRTAIAFSTKDRTELTKQSIEPLLRGNFDLFWVDGSNTAEGEDLPFQYGIPPAGFLHGNVRGGADSAIVFSLTTMLNHPRHYDWVGISENDVLLSDDWFAATMDLVSQGRYDGLEVGSVTARTYVNRILLQRNNYAVLHNGGAGNVIFSRKAAELILQHYRTGYTTDNRRTFMQLSGLDIARWCDFVETPHVTTVDWQFDRILAQHGLASLALTPSKADMIGQPAPLAQLGLELATGPVDERRDDKAFAAFVDRTALIRAGKLSLTQPFPENNLIFAHEIERVTGWYTGDWRLQWSQGFGPFAYRSDGEAEMHAWICGACTVMVSGGTIGGKVRVTDTYSGYEQVLTLSPEDTAGMMQMTVPAGVSYREIILHALTPGVIFYGIAVNEPQVVAPNVKFDHSSLPGV